MRNKYNAGDILHYTGPISDPFHILIEDFIAGDTIIGDKCWGLDVYMVRFLEDNDTAAIEKNRMEDSPHYTKVG